MNLSKHVALTSTHEVDDICQPLKQYLKINYFHYQRNFIDRNNNVMTAAAVLGNNAEILEFTYNYPREKRETPKYDFSQPISYSLFETEQPKLANDMRQTYKLYHPFYKGEKVTETEWDYFLFATTESNPKFLDLYLNHRDYLDKFIMYFKERAAKLITKSHKNKILSGREIISINDAITSNEQFLNSIEPKHYFLTDKNGNKVAVPAAEMRCLNLFARGRTAKDTARILNLSYRTVEFNWSKTKKRLGCNSATELLDIL